VRAHPVEQPHARLGIGHPDVNVQREGRLTARQLAHGAIDQVVAGATGEHRFVPDGERVGGRARAAQAERHQLAVELAPQMQQLVGSASGGLVHAGAHLECRAVGLRGHACRQIIRQRRQDPVHLLGQ